MSHEHKTPTGKDRLVYMANQIASFFETMPHDEGAAGVAKHINDFWDPRMRRQFFEVVDTGGPGLKPLVMDAVDKIRRPAPAEKPVGAA